MKICSSCGTDDSKVIFRKNRNQCADCYNLVRRAGFRKKIARETIILGKKYKHEWYLNNKEEISEQNKKTYLANRNNRLQKAKENYYANFAGSLIRSLKQRSKIMGVAFDLDKNFIELLNSSQNGKCALTGIDFIFDKTNSSRRPFAPSIDRVNSKLGYTKDNVRLVCTIVNLALNEFGDVEFDKMCRRYVDFQDEK